MQDTENLSINIFGQNYNLEFNHSKGETIIHLNPYQWGSFDVVMIDEETKEEKILRKKAIINIVQKKPGDTPYLIDAGTGGPFNGGKKITDLGENIRLCKS